jgi:hypothetical protein
MVKEIRTVVTSGRVILTRKRHEGVFRNAEKILYLDFNGTSTGIDMQKNSPKLHSFSEDTGI